MIDIAIIGAGPAGLSAAANCAARGLSSVIFGKPLETSALFAAPEINNHLGGLGKSGEALLREFTEHVEKLGVEVRRVKVLKILRMGEGFGISYGSDFAEARAVILACGKASAATLPGEARLLGKGVSYCATCDGMLYKNRRVVLYTEEDGEEALHDTAFLSSICEEVTVLDASGKFSGFSFNAGNVRLISVEKKTALRLAGEKRLEAIFVGDKEIHCDAAFLLKKSANIENLLDGLKTSEDGASLIVGKNMETNIPGVFACGDVTGAPYQLSKAIGEGQIAALRAARELKQV